MAWNCVGGCGKRLSLLSFRRLCAKCSKKLTVPAAVTESLGGHVTQTTYTFGGLGSDTGQWASRQFGPHRAAGETWGPYGPPPATDDWNPADDEADAAGGFPFNPPRLIELNRLLGE